MRRTYVIVEEVCLIAQDLSDSNRATDPEATVRTVPGCPQALAALDHVQPHAVIIHADTTDPGTSALCRRLADLGIPHALMDVGTGPVCAPLPFLAAPFSDASVRALMLSLGTLPDSGA